MIIRHAQAQDYRATESLMRDAFWNVYTPGCSEHYLMHIMRRHVDYLAELDFVAITDGRIIGNIAYTTAAIKNDDGTERGVITLGPVAVSPDCQGGGVGAALIRHSIDYAREMWCNAVVLSGDPDYYSRFGFVAAEKYGIRMSDNMYVDALMIYPLRESVLNHVGGRYIENDVYAVDENDVWQFDSAFLEKEKISGTKSQLRFNQLVSTAHAAVSSEDTIK